MSRFHGNSSTAQAEQERQLKLAMANGKRTFVMLKQKNTKLYLTAPRTPSASQPTPPTKLMAQGSHATDTHTAAVTYTYMYMYIYKIKCKAHK